MLEHQDYRISYVPPGRYDALCEMALDLVFLSALVIVAVIAFVAAAHVLPSMVA